MNRQSDNIQGLAISPDRGCVEDQPQRVRNEVPFKFPSSSTCAHAAAGLRHSRGPKARAVAKASRLQQWKQDGKLRAFPGLALDRNQAAMFFNDAARNGQAKPGARPFRGEERFENVRQVIR